MGFRQAWALGLMAMIALSGCGKSSSSQGAAVKTANDPKEQGAAEIEAKASETVKAKTTEFTTYGDKQAAAAEKIVAEDKREVREARGSEKKK